MKRSDVVKRVAEALFRRAQALGVHLEASVARQLAETALQEAESAGLKPPVLKTEVSPGNNTFDHKWSPE